MKTILIASTILSTAAFAPSPMYNTITVSNTELSAGFLDSIAFAKKPDAKAATKAKVTPKKQMFGAKKVPAKAKVAAPAKKSFDISSLFAPKPKITPTKAAAKKFTPAPKKKIVSKPVAKKFTPAAKKAEGKTISRTIFEMDLFAPKATQNDYGARNKMKKLNQGKLNSKSYVPAGLTLAQYQNVRNNEASKKKANYDRNVKKAGVFEDYTEYYLKRGTDTNDSWYKSVTGGHRMAKTKFDWSGSQDTPQWAKVENGKRKK